MSMNNENPGERPTLKNCGPGVAKQEFKEQTDINTIIAHYKKTGELSHIREELGQYVDMRNIPDLQAVLTIAADAHSAFEELPSEVRKACGHDVGNFTEFVQDPENLEFCTQHGLFSPAKPVPISPSPPETPAESPAEPEVPDQP